VRGGGNGLEGALLAFALSAAPAMAAEPSFWVKCDGMRRPEGAAEVAARIGAVVFSAGLLGLPENSRSEPAASGAEGVAACTEALASPDLGSLWARRVSLLQARARHHAEANDLDAALTDLEATSGASAGHVDEVSYGRSFGLSTQLFKAAILMKRGRFDEGEVLAAKAADERPYAIQVQTLAADLLALDPHWTAAKDRLWVRLGRLNPDRLASLADLREWGPDQAAAADAWEAVLAHMDGLVADERRYFSAESFDADRTRKSDTALAIPLVVARTAAAEARAGHRERSEALIARFAALKPPAIDPKARRGELERQSREAALTEARIVQGRDYIAAAEIFNLKTAGQADEAANKVRTTARIPVYGGAPDLVALGGRQSAEDLTAKIRENQRTDRLAKLAVTQYAQALPPLEAAVKPSAYASEGLFRRTGFSDDEIKTGGRTIRYTGILAESAVEELMLMRAAQLAKDSGVKGFVIVDRRNYRRTETVRNAYSSTTYSAGFRSEADVKFAVPGSGWQVFDADQVWADLAPYYVAPTATAAR
jgi:hypothetical protein